MRASQPSSPPLPDLIELLEGAEVLSRIKDLRSIFRTAAEYAMRFLEGSYGLLFAVRFTPPDLTVSLLGCCVSDGTDTPTRLVLNARAAGLATVALTDHDTLDGIQEARAAGRRMGIHVVPGVELSAEVDGREVHLLGYGTRPDHRDLNAELTRIRLGRRDRLPAMLDKLARLGLGKECRSSQTHVPIARRQLLVKNHGAEKLHQESPIKNKWSNVRCRGPFLQCTGIRSKGAGNANGRGPS